MAFSLCVSVFLPRFSFPYKDTQAALVVKNPPANAGDIRDVGSIPGSGRSPGGQHGNPLQYSCLGNPMDRGGWWAKVHGDPKEFDLAFRLNNKKLALVAKEIIHFLIQSRFFFFFDMQDFDLFWIHLI